MRFDMVTIFPQFFSGPFDCGIIRRAREAGLVEIHVHDLRDWTYDRHRTVDDRPFGGGEGMVLKPEPLFEAVESLLGGSPASAAGAAVVLLSAAGKPFCQETARRFAQFERAILLCGRYEGVDERVAEHLATEEISIGDFVLSGGELPAAMIVDAVTRLLPGALGNEASAVEESFSLPAPSAEFIPPAGRSAASLLDQGPSAGVGPRPPSRPEGLGAGLLPAAPGGPFLAADLPPRRWAGILDCPHYTRPQVFRGWAVPEVLVSGNHEEIRRWRRKMALAKTRRNRPDLLAALTDEDRRLLETL